MVETRHSRTKHQRSIVRKPCVSSTRGGWKERGTEGRICQCGFLDPDKCEDGDGDTDKGHHSEEESFDEDRRRRQDFARGRALAGR
jgi:hypothetical protein